MELRRGGPVSGRLTAAFVKSVRHRGGRARADRHHDGGHGLFLQVIPSGSKHRRAARAGAHVLCARRCALRLRADGADRPSPGRGDAGALGGDRPGRSHVDAAGRAHEGRAHAPGPALGARRGAPSRHRPRQRMARLGVAEATPHGFRSTLILIGQQHRSPPERRSTGASRSGSRNASAATSRRRSISHPPAASIASWSRPCSSRSAFISPSSSGSAKRAPITSKRSSNRLISPTPSSTLPRTSFARSRAGSCGRYPTRSPGRGRASPWWSRSTPAMMRSSDDFPAPFRPSTPILAPGKNDGEMSLRISRLGGATLVTRFMV